MPKLGKLSLTCYVQQIQGTSESLARYHMIVMLNMLTLVRNPTSSNPMPPSSSVPVTWEPHTVDHRKYLFLDNDHTEVRENHLSLETSFWNNYIPHLARERDLHRKWEWDGPQIAPAALFEAFKMVKGNHHNLSTELMQNVPHILLKSNLLASYQTK